MIESMLAEWSVECSVEDPVLVVPWRDPNGTAAFVDLRANPYDFDSIHEAEQHPPLMQALRALNTARSPVFTAKCDAWPLAADELSELRINLDASTAETSAGFASYIDMVYRDRAIFASFHLHEQRLRRLAQLATPLDHSCSALECVLRPALLDLQGPQEGFAISLYVKTLATDSAESVADWGAALAAVVALIRSKDFAR